MGDICGIYKITSPSGRVYIGESKGIKKRWKSYNRLSCKRQPKLYESFYKYGVLQHIFEIIEECPSEDLLCRERYWQDFYDVLKEGLNCRLTECGELKQVPSQETRDKLKKSKLGGLNPMFGKRQSEHSIKLRVEQVSGDKHYLYGKTLSEEIKIKISNTRKILNTGKGGNNPKAKEVICLTTGIFYSCAKEAAKAYNITDKYLQAMLRGKRKNKTSLIYADNYIKDIQLITLKKYERKLKEVVDISTGIVYESSKIVSKIFNINYSTLKSKLNGGLKNNTTFKYVM